MEEIMQLGPFFGMRRWAVLLMVCGPACTPVVLSAGEGVSAAPRTNSAWVEHLKQLEERVPPNFTVVVQPPFVVIGDESPATVGRRATNTVQWAVDRLKQDFFRKDPQEIIDVWLFQDASSYTSHARSLFGDTPSTPFGYYSPQHRALIMNIATGGGTLVHEIVHPFLRANFPACPAWLSEGLASLYEQSTEKNGHICGLVNWRWKGLAQAIRERKTVSFQRLTAMNEAEFYGSTGGDRYSQHYAQARYLCYYLQEKGVLVRFYHEFVAHAKQDPSGLHTLKRVLGEEDLVAFKQKWEKFVLELRSL
jgi:hypothetical protein